MTAESIGASAMNEYTPDTETVRAGWATSCIADSITGSANGFRREFDRWLAAHEAAIRADEQEKTAARIDALYQHWLDNDDDDTAGLWWAGWECAMTDAIAAARGGEKA